jgi:hypothetical protein
MSLQLFITSLSLGQLKELISDMNEAGIKREFKGDYRTIFRKKRETKTGRMKKIYAALSKCSKEEMDRISDALVNFEYLIKDKRENEQR